MPIQIIELRLPQSKPLASLPHVLKNLTIFEADVPIIVCNPVATPLSNILASPLPHNTILVLSSRVYEDELDEIIQKHSPHHRPFKCIPVDPKRAVDAIDALESDGEYPHTIARFQRDFIDSNVHVVIHALHDKLESNGSMSALLALRVKTALYHIQDALSGGLTSVRETRQDLNRASIDTNNLRAKIEEAQARVQGDVFGGPLKTDVDQVTAAIRLAEAEMRPVMNRLTWWRMIWRVDEISSIVGHTVIRTWCQALGQKVGTGLFGNIPSQTLKCLRPAYSTYWSLISTTAKYDGVCIHPSLYTSKYPFSRITQYSSPTQRITKISSCA